jgi:hypothetical protein
MRRRRAGRVKAGRTTLAMALVFAAAIPSTADATAFQISNLHVAGGAGWRPDPNFVLEWDRSPPPPASPSALLYRIYDSTGALVQATVRNDEAGRRITIQAPGTPDAYGAELWLEDTEGQMGPPAQVTLRFDDAVPAAPVPSGPPGWLAAQQLAVLDIGLSPAPLPVSGIRGYAISVDSGGGSSPCAETDRCTLAEMDLPGEIEDNTIALGALAEGTSYARVVAVSNSGVASAVAGVPIRVDGTAPELSLLGRPDSGWSRGPLQLTAIAGDPLSGMTATGAAGPFTAIAVDGSPPNVEHGDRALVSVAGTGAHQVAYFARDAAGNVNDGQLRSADPLTATVRIDEEPPQVAFAPAQDRAEPERIEAIVDDADSGISADSGTIGLRPIGGAGRFQELRTQATGNRLVAHWASEAFAPGRYEFLATGFDRVGNRASSGYRRNGLKMVLANPLKMPVRLEAGFGSEYVDSQRRAIGAGRGALFTGKLKSAGGNSLGGLPIAITETFATAAEPPRRITVVRTGSDGAFLLRLPPGPSRDVSASFSGSPTLTRASAPSVHLGVRASVRLKVSRDSARIGGAPVVFSGKVAGAGAASRKGLPVELQFRYRGAGWSEFRTVETDARGRFRYAYRFSDDDSRGIRFAFRAFVGQRKGWPYEPAFSHPVAVIGR